jgi:hypothetical protein
MTVDGPVSESGSNSKAAGCGIAVGVIFAVIGIGVLIGALASALYAMDASGWMETPCQIVTAELDESHSDDGTTYRADFTYAYQIDGKNYVGDQDTVMQASGSRKSAKQRLAELPVGTETVCYVNPDDPAESILDRSFPVWGVTGLSAFGLVFGGFGAFVAYSSYKTGQKAKQRQVRLAAGSTSVSSFGEANDYFHTDVIDREDDREQSLVTESMSGRSLKVRGRGVPDIHPADVEDRKADEPQRLKAESSRLGTLVAVTLIALFWNGIVSVFVWNLIFDNPGGFFSWFLGLFLTPFVLIGLLLIAGVVHSFISLFNPTISIALSSGAVSRGGTIDVAWEVSGGIRSIDRLSISVVGTEWARYQRGTDTIVDESTFEVVPIVSTDQSDEIKFGSATITIPEDTMHSLDLTNNKIKWAVVANGSIAWWPDVSGNYPFRVTPRQVAGLTQSTISQRNDHE